jgi:hypothetical protein
MSRHTEKAHAWVTGTVGRTHREEVKQPEIYRMAESLGLSSDKTTWLDSEAMREWIHSNKDKKFVPEWMLRKLKEQTYYDYENSAFSIVDGTVIPEQFRAVDDSIPTSV